MLVNNLATNHTEVDLSKGMAARVRIFLILQH